MQGRVHYPIAIITALAWLTPVSAAAQQVAMPVGIQEQDGTWAHVVMPSTIVESHLEGDLGVTESGIDAQFMAEASVHASYTRRGPDRCSGEADGVADMRLIGMKLFSRDVPFMSGEQESRLIVNQETRQAALYLHGDVREYGPAPTYCDDGKLQLVGSGRGMLRMVYDTQNHVMPLNFQAYPRAWEIDQEGFAEACDRMRDLMLRAYREINPRWGLINVDQPPGPIDFSILIPNIPPVQEGLNNGTEASFNDGTFNTQTALAGADALANAITLTQALAAGAGKGPAMVASNATQWTLGYALGIHAPTTSAATAATQLYATMVDFHQNMAWDPATRHNAEYAVKPVTMGETVYAGIDADYLARMMLETCDSEQPFEVPSGYAAGHFSKPTGTLQLIGRGPVAGVPAAFANGAMPAGGSNAIADALAMAATMGVEVPDMAAIED